MLPPPAMPSPPVTRYGRTAFRYAFPLAGALVTDHGGMLSHAAIVARERGIPAVVGTGNATTRIPDGVQVRIDGDNRWLPSRPADPLTVPYVAIIPVPAAPNWTLPPSFT